MGLQEGSVRFGEDKMAGVNGAAQSGTEGAVEGDAVNADPRSAILLSRAAKFVSRTSLPPVNSFRSSPAL